MATLTYVYADSTCVLGPLATYAEPHTYDLCANHAQRLTAPRGWDVVRLDIDMTPPEPSADDLVALADAVRKAAEPKAEAAEPEPPRRSTRSQQASDPALLSTTSRKRHLRALRSEDAAEGQD